MYTGPNIVKDGLVICIDAASRKCYPGTGVSAYNLASGEDDGTLTNGPLYGTDKFGTFTFDGVNDYIEIPFNSNTMDFSLGQTICMWIKPTTGSDSARRNPYNQAYGGSGTITHETNKQFNYYFGTNGGNASPYVGRGTTFTVEPEELAFISVSRDQINDTCKWYKNAQLTNSATAAGYAATANGSSPIWIGEGYVSGFLGNIYTCIVYNRGLNTSEILQNYNATKSRFNL